MDDKPVPISEAELDVLKVLWDIGSGTIREVDDALNRDWAYTTVATLLARLQAKGYVQSKKSGVAYVFSPRVSRDKLLRQRLSSLATELCEGTSTPLVHALVQGRVFSREEIQAFRKLLDELESRPKRARKKPGR